MYRDDLGPGLKLVSLVVLEEGEGESLKYKSQGTEACLAQIHDVVDGGAGDCPWAPVVKSERTTEGEMVAWKVGQVM